MGGTPTKLKSLNEIYIIGAGPVGLWTAYNILLNDTTANITLYEKRKEYTRSNNLNINVNELIHNIKKYNHEFSEKLTNDIKTLMGDHSHIRTNELEHFLKNIIKEFTNVKFTTDDITDPKALTADIIIGADGANSIVRRKIFCDDMSVKENLQKTIMVRFKIAENRKNDGYLASVYRMIQSRVIHNVIYSKPDNNNITQATMIIIPSHDIQKIIDESPPEPTNLYENPWNLYRKSTPEKVIELVKNTIKTHGLDLDSLNELKIKYVALNNYAATNFTKCDGAKWFLVGDAASGVPFFRSLNKGLKEGLVLANNLKKFKDGTILNFEDYNKFMKDNTLREILRARAYSLAVNVRRKYLTWTGGTPKTYFKPLLICSLQYWIIIAAIILLILITLIAFHSIRSRPDQVSSKLSTRLRLGFHPLTP